MPNLQTSVSKDTHKITISFSPQSSHNPFTKKKKKSSHNPQSFNPWYRHPTSGVAVWVCLFVFVFQQVSVSPNNLFLQQKCVGSFPSYQCPSSTDSKLSLMLLLGTAGHMGTPAFHPGRTRMWYGAFRWWIGIGVVLLTRMSCSKLFLLRTRGFVSGLSASSCFSSRIPTTH